MRARAGAIRSAALRQVSSPSIAANPKLRIPLLEENQSDP